jgi:UDP-N-acetylglucosamine--N-acetylmuramyl-(pentapeptide) pyrophosphoryl-undecaprenol N-acetylglucosamine transferase
MRAVADALRDRGLDASDLRFVGSRRGQESTLLGPHDVALTLLPGRGIRRSFAPDAILDNLAALAALLGAATLAAYYVRRWRPSVVVSLGGYASFATSLAAVLWRRPLVLVELDAEAGAAQRILARFARARCTAFPTSEPRTVVTGTPLRADIVAVQRTPDAQARARRALVPPIEDGRQVVVVMTGSLGSTTVNRAVLDLARRWSSRTDRTLIHVSGRRDFEMVRREAPPTNGLDYRVVEFADMVELWSVCEVAICRAGASTLAELTTLAIPSIIVPLPGMGEHQTKNALVVVDAGGARLLRDDECTGAALDVALEAMMTPDTLAAMAEHAATLGRRDAASRIASVVSDVGGWS